MNSSSLAGRADGADSYGKTTVSAPIQGQQIKAMQVAVSLDLPEPRREPITSDKSSFQSDALHPLCLLFPVKRGSGVAAAEGQPPTADRPAGCRNG